jgi:hypothetical protein
LKAGVSNLDLYLFKKNRVTPGNKASTDTNANVRAALILACLSAKAINLRDVIEEKQKFKYPSMHGLRKALKNSIDLSFS